MIQLITWCVLGLALYAAFMVLAPDLFVIGVWAAVAGWQIGQWIFQIAKKLTGVE